MTGQEVLIRAGRLSEEGKAYALVIVRGLGHHASVFIGGAPETSCRWVSAS